MRRRRWRTVVLWVGCTLCVLIAVAFMASGWSWITFQTHKARGQPSEYFRDHKGLVLILSMGSAKFRTNSESIVDVLPAASPRLFDSAPFAEWHPFDLQLWNRWRAQLSHPITGARPYFQIEFPLWLPFLAVAVPTLFAWRFGRKPIKPGHCRCGYDLTGNESGKCPECGVEVRA